MSRVNEKIKIFRQNLRILPFLANISFLLYLTNIVKFICRFGK